MDIGNNENWLLVADWDLHANKLSGSVLYPVMIGEKFQDIDGNRPLVAIKTITASVEPWWKYAGYLRRKIYPNLTGIEEQATLAGKEIIPLNKTRLYQFNSFTSDYALALSIFLWIQHIQIQIWVYTGTDNNDNSNNEILTTINTNIQAIGEVLGVGES